MSMDLLNSTGNWLDQGISLYPNYAARADFAHLFMRSTVAQIQSPLHTHGWRRFLDATILSFDHQLDDWGGKTASRRSELVKRNLKIACD